jgi:hypothetical protein
VPWYQTPHIPGLFDACPGELDKEWAAWLLYIFHVFVVGDPRLSGPDLRHVNAFLIMLPIVVLPVCDTYETVG